MANIKKIKRTRSYNSTGRHEQARRSRWAILDAAQRGFLDAGYAATTIAAIANEAGVSVETIYKNFGGKAGLVRALYERGLEGIGTDPAYDRSDQMRARETDPKTIMREWGALTAEVGSEVTFIRLLIRGAAATDPEIAELLMKIEADRMKRMRHHARFLAKRGCLRPGVSVSEASDVLWTCSSVELHDLLMVQRKWSAARFGRFIGDLMIAQLLPEGA